MKGEEVMARNKTAAKLTEGIDVKELLYLLDEEVFDPFKDKLERIMSEAVNRVIERAIQQDAMVHFDIPNDHNIPPDRLPCYVRVPIPDDNDQCPVWSFSMSDVIENYFSSNDFKDGHALPDDDELAKEAAILSAEMKRLAARLDSIQPKPKRSR